MFLVNEKQLLQTRKERKMRVTNKHQQVLEHLQTNGNITSWEAIQQYGATRLSSIIFNLRKRGYDIDTETIRFKDRNGNEGQYAKYILNKED